MQGQITQWTREFIDKYLQYEFVDKLVVSTWEDEDFSYDSSRVNILRNKKPYNPGLGNRNLQIVSSFEGIKRVDTEYCLKVRSDMLLHELQKMYNFFLTKREKKQIFCACLYDWFFAHPRDHFFMGEQSDLYNLFNIPLDTVRGDYIETINVRSETYIGSFYYALFNSKIYDFIRDPEKYMTDKSPNKQEAMDIYLDLIKQKIGFVPFERTAITWPKYYPNGYPFDFLSQLYGEKYYSDIYKD